MLISVVQMIAGTGLAVSTQEDMEGFANGVKRSWHTGRLTEYAMERFQKLLMFATGAITENAAIPITCLLERTRTIERIALTKEGMLAVRSNIAPSSQQNK